MGGAISDLVSRVSKLENNTVKRTNWSGGQTLLWMGGGEGEIVPNWHQTDNPFKQLVIPSDGWLVINLHAENTPQNPVDSNDFLQTRLDAYVNNLLMCEADASTGGYKTHVESSDTNTIPVKTGDVIKYGSNGAMTPNGRYNYIRLFLAPFVN